MNTAAELYLTRYRWPEGSGLQVMTPAQLREALRTAYLAGYTDGRAAALPTRSRSNDAG